MSLTSNLSNIPPINTFFSQEMLSVMYGSEVKTNMLEYLSQVEKYQNAVKQYQNNLNINPHSKVSYCKIETKQHLPHPILSNISTVENGLGSVKDRKDVSITPISLTNSNIKSKFVDLSSSHACRNKSTVSVPVPELTQRSQFSSSNQTSNLMRPSSLLPINDVQNSLSVHSISSDNLPSNYSTTDTSKNQFSSLPSERHSSRENISLQHKLLSKKHHQQIYGSPQQVELVKKQKPCTNNSSDSISFYPPSTAHSTTGGNNYLNSAITKKFLGSTQKKIRPKISFAPSLATSPPDINSSFSMISQLQQLAHLEIIPQSNIGPGTENTLKRSYPDQNQSELLPLLKMNKTLVSESSKQIITISSSSTVKFKNQDESKDDNVEIITLDD